MLRGFSLKLNQCEFTEYYVPWHSLYHDCVRKNDAKQKNDAGCHQPKYFSQILKSVWGWIDGGSFNAVFLRRLQRARVEFTPEQMIDEAVHEIIRLLPVLNRVPNREIRSKYSRRSNGRHGVDEEGSTAAACANAGCMTMQGPHRIKMESLKELAKTKSPAFAEKK